jgi:single-strand DNA-binding protein
MANFNKVLLMGNLTRDPELRYAGGGSGGGSGGTAICKFGLAVNRQWRDQAGQSHDDVCFVDLTVFGRQAETCNEYLKKGRPVFVEGRLQFSQWEDKEGQKRSKLEVVAERVQFLASREGAGNGSGGGGGGGGYAPREHVPAQQPAYGGRTPQRHDPVAEGVQMDDIPF